MKKLSIKRIVTFIVILCLLFSFGTFQINAVEITTKDINYYNTSHDSVVKSISSILNDASWKSWVKVSEAENGTKIEWKNAVRNVRVEGGTDSVNLAGFHAVFSELSGSEDTSIGFTFTERQGYSDFIDIPLQNQLARLPLVINLDMKTGSVIVYTAKAFHTQNNNVIRTTVIENNDNLKYSALAGKQWEFRVDYDKETEKWVIDVAGEKAYVDYSVLFDITSEIDFTKVYFCINAWKSGNNNFSLVWNSFHGGDSACADDPSSQGLLNSATNLIKDIDNIGVVTADKGEKIESIRLLYDNMPRATKTLIKNYNKFEIKENAYRLVEQIDSLDKVSEESLKFIQKIDKEFAALKNEEKKEVSNYNNFIRYKADYQKLMLKELANRENVIEKDVIVSSKGEDTEITTVIDVDGGTKTTKKTNTITTNGLDGTQYLWIIFTVSGALLAVIAAVFVIALIKNKKRRSL